MHNFPRTCLAFCALTFAALFASAADPAPAEVTLTKRANNGAYGTSAYSFRLASQDLAVHHNYVDLVFNGCGQLHINPVSGMSSRVTDLGAVAFPVPAPAASAEATWRQRSITPQAGHVYLQEIKDERQSFAVEFLVTDATADIVKLRWQPVDPAHQMLPLEPGRGAAGTNGQCGGTHPEK